MNMRKLVEFDCLLRERLAKARHGLIKFDVREGMELGALLHELVVEHSRRAEDREAAE